ncbi:MAG: M1 family aminopeptidase [Candidatus Eisenbacteria bacterium]
MCAAALIGVRPQEARAADGYAPLTDHEIVERILTRRDEGMAAKDTAAVLDLYDDTDASLRQKTRDDLQGLFALDSLECGHRLAGITGKPPNPWRALVMQWVLYRQNGREHVIPAWSRIDLRSRDCRVWIIAEKETREVARAEKTDLAVALFPEEGRMEAEAAIKLRALEPDLDVAVLSLNRGLAVSKVTGKDGEELAFERRADALFVTLPKAAKDGDTVQFTVRYAGSLFNETKEFGYSQVAISPEGSFASWVTNWYPRLLGDGSKARGTIRFEVPAGLTVACSGRPAGKTPALGDAREEQRFKVSVPSDFSFAAARTFDREEQVTGTPVAVHLLEGGQAKADLYLPMLARILAVERETHEMYPYDGYAIVEIPATRVGSLGGSSEQGMNLFPTGMLPDDRVPLPLLAHELGHSWWGNLVGSAGAVVSEGLAQMMAVRAIRAIEGDEAALVFLNNGVPAYRQSAREYFTSFAGRPELDLPIAAAPRPGTRDQMTLHSLADRKGQFVYEMLRERIGEAAFTAGLRAAVRDFARRTISLEDLRRKWEDASGQDLRPFFAAWFEQSGAPEFAMDARTERVTDGKGGWIVRGAVKQAGTVFPVDAEIAIVRGNEARFERVRVDAAETPFSIRVEEKPDTVVFDPRLKILRWTQERRHLGELENAAALRAAGRIDSALARLDRFRTAAGKTASERVERGACLEAQGDFAAAEECWRDAVEGRRPWMALDPAVTIASLRLGHSCDAAGRRDEALRWYAEALRLPDADGAHAEATAGLAAPRVRPAPRAAAGPGAPALARLTGSYAAPDGWSFRVGFAPDSTLSVYREGDAPAALLWEEGLRFRLQGAEGVTARFDLDGAEPGVEVSMPGRVVRFRRIP